MMIKITEKCSMGCKHCMNDAKATGKEMSIETLKDVLAFLEKSRTDLMLIVTGGEPTEHSKFMECMQLIIDHSSDSVSNVVTVTTNGVWMAENPADFNRLNKYAEEKDVELLWQVSTIAEYYPKKIDITKKVYRHKKVTICTTIEKIYPQGRALTNKIPWQAVGSKCFNVRAISKQIKDCTLNGICTTLMLHAKFCTPHIKIDGGIGL